MANIRVHLLNFHGVFHSHIEIVLEDLSGKEHAFYNIDRWDTARDKWEKWPEKYIAKASSVYHFDIIAAPHEITESWIKYWDATLDNSSILGDNCAVATQWFLSKFANIPKPDFSNLSLNYLGCGVVWPSFIPCVVTLPGRVFSNAKFHIEAKNNPEISAQYNRLFFAINMSLALLAFGASVALFVAITLPLVIATLTLGLTAVLSIGCLAVGLLDAYGFFKAQGSKESFSDKSFNDAKRYQPNDRIPVLAA